MTPNKRIVLNVLATYGRSFYKLVIGLFCGRWALQALGEVDYGLYGLIGGMTAFVAFFNELLSFAVGRFYGVAVGNANRVGNSVTGLEECRRWFNTALSIYSIVPICLLSVGYPIGEWTVCHFLTIPSDRIVACLWVWRFTCASCFSGMVSVPFNALYLAKQEIAELTIYSFVTTTLNVVVLYYMISHDEVWLTRYALWLMLQTVVPNLIIMVRARCIFPECRVVIPYLFDMGRVKNLVCFAIARFWTALAQMIGNQGNAVLVNKYLGPAFNASMGIGSMVAGHAVTLSGSLSGAFWPVIMNKAGEQDYEGMRRHAFRVCRIGTLLVNMFALPLMLEVDEVMNLWLKVPPAFVSIICITILIDIILERMTEGYWMAIMAKGDGIGVYSLYASLSGFSKFFLAWAAFAIGWGVHGLCVSIVFARFVVIVIRLVLGQRYVAMSARLWFLRVFSPILGISLSVLLIVFPLRYVMAQSFLRICSTTMLCLTLFVPLAWRFVMDGAERQFCVAKLSRFLPVRRI